MNDETPYRAPAEQDWKLLDHLREVKAAGYVVTLPLAPVANPDRVAEVLREVFSTDDGRPVTWHAAANALLAAGVFRDEAAVKAEVMSAPPRITDDAVERITADMAMLPAAGDVLQALTEVYESGAMGGEWPTLGTDAVMELLAAAAPQPDALQMGELADALLIVDGYDVMEGDEVPERELWAVVAAARKVLDAAPQPVVDREALEKAIEQAASDVDLAKYFLPGTTDCFTDAVLALLNGSANV